MGNHASVGRKCPWKPTLCEASCQKERRLKHIAYVCWDIGFLLLGSCLCQFRQWDLESARIDFIYLRGLHPGKSHPRRATQTRTKTSKEDHLARSLGGRGESERAQRFQTNCKSKQAGTSKPPSHRRDICRYIHLYFRLDRET